MFLSSLRSAVKRYRYRAPKTSPHRFGAVKRFHTSKFVLNAVREVKELWSLGVVEFFQLHRYSEFFQPVHCTSSPDNYFCTATTA